MVVYEKQSYLARYNNYHAMLTAGIPAKPPSFMNLRKPIKTFQKIAKKTGDEEWSTDDFRVNTKELSIKETHSCINCKATFKSKRLFDNHMKQSCLPFAERIDIQSGQPVTIVSSQMTNPTGSQQQTPGTYQSFVFKHRIISNWREDPINRRPVAQTVSKASSPDLENPGLSIPPLSASPPQFYPSASQENHQDQEVFNQGNQESFSFSQETAQSSVSEQFDTLFSLNSDQVPSENPGFSQQSISSGSQSMPFRRQCTPFGSPPTSLSEPPSSQQGPVVFSTMRNKVPHNNNKTHGSFAVSLDESQVHSENPGSSQQSISSSSQSMLFRNQCTPFGSPPTSLSEPPSSHQGSVVFSTLRNQVPHNNIQTHRSCSVSLHGNQNSTSTLTESQSSSLCHIQPVNSRRPLPNIQIRESRFVVVDASSDLDEILPDRRDPNFVQALNIESRVNRLMAEAISSLKYKYNLRAIIQKAPKGPIVLEALDRGDFVHGVQRNTVVNALVDHLFKSVSSKALVSTVMRECMAIQVMAEWPALKKYLYTQEDRPWHHWYNADQNTGYLENVTQVIQRTSKRPGSNGIRKARNSTGKRKARKLVEAAIPDINHDDSDPEEYLKDVADARTLVAHIDHKQTILELMAQTFERRISKIVVKQVDTIKILCDFPHLMHFQGEVIEQEFNLMFEQKQSCFVQSFVYDLVPKLLKIADLDPQKYENCTPSAYDVINAILILTKMLPTPIRTMVHERKMPLQADLIDFFNLIPAGSDPALYIEDRQAQSEYKIQPHILATSSQQRIQKMWLVVDGKFLEFHRNATPVTAIDILIKSFFVFHLHFPLAWKNLLRYLQVHIFQIPLEKDRRRLSTFPELH